MKQELSNQSLVASLIASCPRLSNMQKSAEFIQSQTNKKKNEPKEKEDKDKEKEEEIKSIN